jgi:DNA-binding response OmpR family regulator
MKVLVVDDEPVVADFIAISLRKAGCTVIIAPCGRLVSGGAGLAMLSTADFKDRCWGLLEKPFRPKQLLQAVHRLLEMRRMARSA